MMERKPRADSLRNRDLLLTSAKTAFAEAGTEVALEDIARLAGVGIGTLYRHFPTRGALIAAVYQRELEQLTAAADRLSADHSPVAALEAWLYLLIDYMATKRVVAPALQADPGEGARVYASAGPALMGAISRLTRAAIEAGEIREDVSEEDVQRMLMGMSHGYSQPGWEDSARRIVSILVAGLRTAR